VRGTELEIRDWWVDSEDDSNNGMFGGIRIGL